MAKDDVIARERRADDIDNIEGTNIEMTEDRGVAEASNRLAAVVAASPRSRIRRHADRAVPEQAEAILRAGRVAHVAFVAEGQPFVIPFLYHYGAGLLYLHGAQANHTLHMLGDGAPVCVEVTLLDGLVASRGAADHSANYRSIVVFGRAVPVTDPEEKRSIFERMTLRYFPGRTAGADYLPASDGDLRGVALLAVAIEELSAKARSGPPRGKHDRDSSDFGSSYVLVLGGHDA